MFANDSAVVFLEQTHFHLMRRACRNVFKQFLVRLSINIRMNTGQHNRHRGLLDFNLEDRCIHLNDHLTLC